jgi:hypothetical protein
MKPFLYAVDSDSGAGYTKQHTLNKPSTSWPTNDDSYFYL